MAPSFIDLTLILKDQMKTLVLFSLLAFSTSAFAADLDLDSVKKRLERNVQLLAAISLKGAEAPAVAEIIKHHIDIFNEIVKSQEAKEIEVVEEPKQEIVK